MAPRPALIATRAQQMLLAGLFAMNVVGCAGLLVVAFDRPMMRIVAAGLAVLSLAMLWAQIIAVRSES